MYMPPYESLGHNSYARIELIQSLDLKEKQCEDI